MEIAYKFYLWQVIKHLYIMALNRLFNEECLVNLQVTIANKNVNHVPWALVVVTTHNITETKRDTNESMFNHILKATPMAFTFKASDSMLNAALVARPRGTL